MSGAPIKDEHRALAGELYRNQFPRGDNYSTAYTTIDAFAQAIADAEARGRVAGIREADTWLQAKRITLTALLESALLAPEKETP